MGVVNYVSRGIEEEVAEKLGKGESVLLVGLPGVGKTTTALAALAKLQGGAFVVMLRLYIGEEAELGYEVVRLEEGEPTPIPIVYVPTLSIGKEEIVRRVIEAAKNDEKLRKLRERLRRLGESRVRVPDKDLLESIVGFLRNVGETDLAEAVDATTRLVPIAGLLLYAIRALVSRMEKRRVKEVKGKLVIAVDDLEDATYLSKEIASLVRELEATVLAVSRVPTYVYLDAIRPGSSMEELEKWAREKGVEADFVKVLEPPDENTLARIVEAAGVKERPKIIERVARITGLNPALTIELARRVGEGKLSLGDIEKKVKEKVEEWKKKGGRIPRWRPELDPEASTLKLYASALELYKNLEEEDFKVVFLVASHPYGASCDELAVFSLLALGLEPEVFGGDKEVVKLYYPEGFENKNWLVAPSRIRRIEQLYKPREDLAEEDWELWPRKPWLPEKYSLCVKGGRRGVYRLRGVLGHLPPLLDELARVDGELCDELVYARRSMLAVLYKEIVEHGINTSRMQLLGCELVKKLWEAKELGGLEKQAARILVDAMLTYPMLARKYGRLALELLDREHGGWLVEAAQLANAVANIAVVGELELGLKELKKLKSVVGGLVKEAREVGGWFALGFLASALAYIAALETLKKEREETLEKARGVVGKAGHPWPIAYAAPKIAASLAELDKLDEASKLLEEAESALEELRGDDSAKDRLAEQGVRDYERQLKGLEARIAYYRGWVESLRGRYGETMRYYARSARLSRECGDKVNETIACVKACLARFLVEGSKAIKEGCEVEGYTLPPLERVEEKAVEWKRGGLAPKPTAIMWVAALAHATSTLTRIAERENAGGEQVMILDPRVYASYFCFRVGLLRVLGRSVGEEVVHAGLALLSSMVVDREAWEKAKKGLVGVLGEEVQETLDKIELGLKEGKEKSLMEGFAELSEAWKRVLLFEGVPDIYLHCDCHTVFTPFCLVAFSSRIEQYVLASMVLAYAFCSEENARVISLVARVESKSGWWFRNVRDAFMYLGGAVGEKEGGAVEKLLKAWCAAHV